MNKKNILLIVLLAFPALIMLFLFEAGDNVYDLHQIYSYKQDATRRATYEQCANFGDTLRVQESALSSFKGEQYDATVLIMLDDEAGTYKLREWKALFDEAVVDYRDSLRVNFVAINLGASSERLNQLDSLFEERFEVVTLDPPVSNYEELRCRLFWPENLDRQAATFYPDLHRVVLMDNKGILRSHFSFRKPKEISALRDEIRVLIYRRLNGHNKPEDVK